MAPKRKRANKKTVVAEPIPEPKKLKLIRHSDEPVKKQSRWINKERVLIFSSRGISFRDRHLMLDLKTMMPHSKSDTKMDRKDQLFVINEIAEMKNCRKCIFFESKKKQDLYMWMSNTPCGPSAKFHVENIHTMSELKLTGNCLKGTRPLLSFDKKFDEVPYLGLLKEMFIQTFTTPNYHPKSQPFIDHIFTFSVADNRIWFRNYQILDANGELAEIGPRLVLNPIKIFKGSFGGQTLFQNEHYISPNRIRRLARQKYGLKYVQKIEHKKAADAKRPKSSYKVDPNEAVFDTHVNEEDEEEEEDIQMEE